MDVKTPLADVAQSIACRAIETVRRQQARITATYRLQLHREFTFRDAIAVLPYFKSLGISHVYCSPYLRARHGSTHGYDICDHSQFNPELGGDEGFQEFVLALHDQGLGHILDTVPNHMAASLENPWWLDVLENGPASPYSSFFDIDWKPTKRELADKVMLPVLGGQYGEALEDGQLQVVYREGAFFVRYFDQDFPLGPKTTVPLLAGGIDTLQATLGGTHTEFTELESIITALEHLPPQSARDAAQVRERNREKEIIKRRLRELTVASEAISEHIQRNLSDYAIDPERPETIDRLDRLLDEQPYRLSHWRSAADEINYRRFFDVNELAAICMESPDVFHCTHAAFRPHLADGTIAGLRIDHVDGLYDPEQYLWRLQWAYLADVAARCFRDWQETTLTAEGVPQISWEDIAPAVLALGADGLGMRQPVAEDLRAVLGPDRDWQPAMTEQAVADRRHSGSDAAPLLVLVEKILGPDEPLPEHWPTAGTSGYDFLNSLGGLFVVPEGYADIQRTYEKFLDHRAGLGDVERTSKLLILRIAMASELQMLAHRLNHISEQHRRSRDFTFNNIRLAIREVLASFPVYRVYPGRDGISDRDRRFVNFAVNRARRQNPAFDPAVFEFLRSVLLLSHPPGLSAEQILERETFTGKFQQVTSPIMAKGVEDTAFYVHVPLVSVNEVGNDPVRAVTSIREFHEANQSRNLRLPRAMLATSTHDTKRSEDVRGRLQVLTEIPREWKTAVHRFARANKKFLREVDGEPAPSPNDEYLFYQSVVGIWPLTMPTAEEHVRLVERLVLYMEKATREAKQRTSWNNPNEPYDIAVREFVTEALDPSPRNRFLKYVTALNAQIAAAGQVSGLGQVALKLLSPGVPDIYQGQELWDFSLVDPDNRRPVDYELRAKLLAELRGWDDLAEDERRDRVISLGRSWDDPRLKLLVTYRLLALRQARPALFEAGRYVPLETAGPNAEKLVAFGWRRGDDQPLDVIAVIPRHVQGLLAPPSEGGNRSLWIEGAWAETVVSIPDVAFPEVRCLFTEQRFPAGSRVVPVLEVLCEFPLAVLHHV